MSKNHKIKKLFLSFFCFLSFCLHIVTCNAAVVGHAGVGLAGLQYIPVGAAARAQIRGVAGWSHMVFSTQGGGAGADALQPVILATLQQIFDPPGGGGVGGHIIAGHTNATDYQSGAPAGNTVHLFAHEAQPIIDAYSQLSIDSSQGLFEIANGFNFFHTEPKALDYLLHAIDLPPLAGPNVTNALLISRRPLCACCARLLLSSLSHRRAAPQNIIIMSRRDFAASWRGAIVAGAHTPAILAAVDGIIGSADEDDPTFRAENAGGNELALLIRY